MTEVYTGRVTNIEADNTVTAHCNSGSIVIPRMKHRPNIGDQITMTVATYDPPPTLTKPSKRKIDPNVEKGRPSVPGGK